MSDFKTTRARRKRKLRRNPELGERFSETPEFGRNGNLRYEQADRIRATVHGGIGAVRKLVQAIGLAEMIDARLRLLKAHKPYHESDHVLNLAYNVVCGGDCLDDIEPLRGDEAYLRALGASRIPDPTTAGDFLRRFGRDDVTGLMHVVNAATQRVWMLDPRNRLGRCAVIDVDGLIATTTGECRERMDLSYKGTWGFSPLVVTESTTGAHLFVVNRPGNAPSHADAGPWIDRAIELARPHFASVALRGDSAFGLTSRFDDWDDAGVRFAFSCGATANLVRIADSLGKSAWRRLERPEDERPRRAGKDREKERVVRRRRFRNQVRVDEHVAEFAYRPTRSRREYRVIVLRATLRVTEGQQFLFEKARYFFYVTNIVDTPAEDALRFARGRCDHENKIAQLKGGVGAFRLPAAGFVANWAYMAICMLAWNIKSWIGQLVEDEEHSRRIIRMEYKRFRRLFVRIPCQIVRTGRMIVYRILGSAPWLETFLRLVATLQGLRLRPG